MTSQGTNPAGWRLGRTDDLGPPEAGFAGPGHTAVEVFSSTRLEDSDPFVLLMDDRIAFAPGQRIGGPHPHAGLETVTFVLDGAIADRDEGPQDLARMYADYRAGRFPLLSQTHVG